MRRLLMILLVLLLVGCGKEAPVSETLPESSPPPASTPKPEDFPEPQTNVVPVRKPSAKFSPDFTKKTALSDGLFLFFSA